MNSSPSLSGLVFIVLLLLCCNLTPVLAEAEVVDRMLVTVNGDAITESDVCWALALDPELKPLDLSVENKRLMLEQLIDQKILSQEAAKIPQNPPTEEEIQDYINKELVARFGSAAALRTRRRQVGLNVTMLREIVTHRLALLKYIDFRFRSFVFVQPDEIERYYHEVALPRMRNRGGHLRPLDEMRAEIEAILITEKMNTELDRFLDEARAQAQIVRLSELQ